MPLPVRSGRAATHQHAKFVRIFGPNQIDTDVLVWNSRMVVPPRSELCPGRIDRSRSEDDDPIVIPCVDDVTSHTRMLAQARSLLPRIGRSCLKQCANHVQLFGRQAAGVLLEQISR